MSWDHTAQIVRASLFRHGHHGFVVAAPSNECHGPALKFGGAVWSPADSPVRDPEHRSRTVREQAAEIAVTAFADAAQVAMSA